MDSEKLRKVFEDKIEFLYVGYRNGAAMARIMADGKLYWVSPAKLTFFSPENSELVCNAVIRAELRAGRSRIAEKIA